MRIAQLMWGGGLTGELNCLIVMYVMYLRSAKCERGAESEGRGRVPGAAVSLSGQRGRGRWEELFVLTTPWPRPHPGNGDLLNCMKDTRHCVGSFREIHIQIYINRSRLGFPVTGMTV